MIMMLNLQGVKMSRPLKFRAWDKKYKQGIPLSHIKIRLDGKLDLPPHCDEENVIIEQYTGLKDKNGKEIYEGDILKIGGQLAEVIFDDDKGSYMGEFKINYRGKTIRDRDYFHDFKESREIVGNIHENLELLWGEDGRDK